MRVKLVIMAKRAVEVRECDRCGKEPAHTWLITGPDGAPREIELCDRHGSPIANAYALARPVAKKKPRNASPRGARRAAEQQTPPPPPPTTLPPLPPDPEPVWR